MTESSLKSALVRELRSRLTGYVILRHEDIRTSGIPDLSITGLGKTTWWEFKHANPKFDTHGIQELTMLRLAGAGYARYVIWEEKGDCRRTMVVHPKNIRELTPDVMLPDFNHRKLAQWIEAVHQGRVR